MTADEMTKFICLFHSPERAESALDALEHAGLQRNTITSTWGSSRNVSQEQSSSELQRIGVPERDVKHLLDGLAHGGVVLSLEAPESQSPEIEKIFHKYSADKIDEADLTPEPAFAAAPVAAAAMPAAVDEAEIAGAVAIPIAEEELVVGKRTVDRGGVRVFRRVVEEPVSEQMQLHEEHVVVERHRVDRAVTDQDLRNGEGTLELVETDEVPVVGKVARVVEEVRVGKTGSDHTEQINDTVRHTEVEVEEVDPSVGTRGTRNETL